MAFPAIAHVAVTVTDLASSAAWYERLLGVPPVLDEDAGGFWHTVYPLAGGGSSVCTCIRRPIPRIASTRSA